MNQIFCSNIVLRCHKHASYYKQTPNFSGLYAMEVWFFSTVMSLGNKVRSVRGRQKCHSASAILAPPFRPTQWLQSSSWKIRRAYKIILGRISSQVYRRCTFPTLVLRAFLSVLEGNIHTEATCKPGRAETDLVLSQWLPSGTMILLMNGHQICLLFCCLWLDQL